MTNNSTVLEDPTWGNLLAGGVGPTWTDFAFLFPKGQIRVQISADGGSARIQKLQHDHPLDFHPDHAEILPFGEFPLSIVLLVKGEDSNFCAGRSAWLRQKYLIPREKPFQIYVSGSQGYAFIKALWPTAIIPQPFPWKVLHETIDFLEGDNRVKTSYALPNGGVVVARQARPAGPIEVSHYKDRTKQTVELPAGITILEGVHPSGLALVSSCAGTLFISKITLKPRLEIEIPRPLSSQGIPNWSWGRLGGVHYSRFAGDWCGRDGWGNRWEWIDKIGLRTDFKGKIEIQSEIRI